MPKLFPRQTLLILLAASSLAAEPALAQPGTARPETSLDLAPISTPAAAARMRLENSGTNPVVVLDFADAPPPPEEGHGNQPATRGPLGQIYDAVSYIVSYVYNTVTTGLTPPSPITYHRSFKTKDPYDFWKLIGDAGYKLKEISTDIGVVPDVGFKFRYVRELSNADVNWLERRLSQHARKFSDPVSFAQRTIIYTLLDINSSDSYFVEELRVKLLPLPKATFVLTPWEGGLSEEHDVLLRAIQGRKRTKRKPSEEDAKY